jgi:hypothetical protein
MVRGKSMKNSLSEIRKDYVTQNKKKRLTALISEALDPPGNFSGITNNA